MMVLPMPAAFAPMENGDYLELGADHYFNYHQIARHSKKDAEAYHDYTHMMDQVCQLLKPFINEVPPNILSQEPEEVMRMAKLSQDMMKPRCICEFQAHNPTLCIR